MFTWVNHDIFYMGKPYTNNNKQEREDKSMEETKELYSIPPQEQETTINFSRTDDTCIVWTSDKTVMTKLDRLCETSDNYEVIKVGKVDGAIIDKEYLIKDKSLISFRSAKVKMNLTEEQRRKKAEQLAEIRKS